MSTLCSAIAENSAAERLTVTRLREVSLGKYDNGCLFIVIEICKPAPRNGGPHPRSCGWGHLVPKPQPKYRSALLDLPSNHHVCVASAMCADVCVHFFFFLLSSKTDVVPMKWPNIQSTHSLKSFPLNSFRNPHCGGLLCNNKENLSVAASL